MRASELLQAARDKISNPYNWARYDYALDENDKVVLPRAENACKWCSLGSIAAVSDPEFTPSSFKLGEEAREFLREAIRQYTNGLLESPISFNDSRSTKHPEVLQVFDMAIEKAKAHEA